MARTPLFSRQAQGGFNDYANFAKHPADIWFVGNCVATATDALGFGLNPDSPFATIDYAVSYCTSGAGDVIYVLPGHVEAVTGAGILDLDCAGITIIGLGKGTYQATISLDAETSDVDIDAASITIEGMHFLANFADVSVAIDVNATDFTLRGCRFTATAACNAEIWVQDAAAAASDRITVEDCWFIDDAATNDECLAFDGTGTGHVVRNNRFSGLWGTACINVTDTCTAMIIADNIIYNVAAASDAAINAATATGLCIKNHGSTGNASADQITAPSMVKCQNYGGLIGDSNGLLEPIAT